MNETSYIYLLQEREFIKTNEQIFKIGKTKQTNFKRYPIGSKIILQIKCDNYHNYEKILLNKFKDLIKSLTDSQNSIL